MLKTIGRWEKGETPCPTMLEPALRDMLQTLATDTATGNHCFRFVDLFAGIGGIRMGFEAHGGKCVFTSEWNEFSKKPISKIMAITTSSSMTSCHFLLKMCQIMTCCWAVFHASR